MSILTAVETVTAEPTVSLARRVRQTVAYKLTLMGLTVLGMLGLSATAASAAPVDPLGGAGQTLVDDLLQNFQTYVIPALVGVIIAVVAFKLIVNLTQRFFNRA